jgi:hypothetical protein
MINKEFIEEYSLFRKFKLNDIPEELENWTRTPINMSCNQCKSNQTFNLTESFLFHNNRYIGSSRDKVINLEYLCQSCQNFKRLFNVHINYGLNEVYKVGQYPQWEIKMDKGLENTLGRHSGNFRKGLVCESQGYGIGANSYYRRIIEEIIDELLDSITELIDIDQREKYEEALKKTKNTRVTQEKINLVKDLLPSILKPNGMNPLGVLHSELSEGLHSLSDEECLESANHIKTILTFLLNQIVQTKQSAQQFTASMQSLLDKKK